MKALLQNDLAMTLDLYFALQKNNEPNYQYTRHCEQRFTKCFSKGEPETLVKQT